MQADSFLKIMLLLFISIYWFDIWFEPFINYYENVIVYDHLRNKNVFKLVLNNWLTYLFSSIQPNLRLKGI